MPPETPDPAPPRHRLALGFAVAPLAVPLLHAALELARSAEGPPGHARYAFADGLHAVVGFTAPLTYAFALGLGIPLVLALRRLGRLTAPWVVGVAAVEGAAAAAAVAVVLARVLGISPLREGTAVTAAIVGVLSAGVAAVFCAVARVPLRRARGGAPPVTSRASP